MLHNKYRQLSHYYLLKNYQDSNSISTICIPSPSTIRTTLLDNIKKLADNIIKTGDLNAKHTDFNCTKTDKWGMALKKALYNADFIDDNSKPTHRDSRTNTSDIIDYIISSPAIFNNIQNLTLNNDLSSDHSAILFDFSTNFNKSMPPPIKVKIYHKAGGDSINSSLSKQLTILQDQVLNLISFVPINFDPINIINTAATILPDSMLNIYINLPEKTVKPNTSVPFSIQLLIKQKKIKRTFIEIRNPFLKSAMNAISKKLKKLIKSQLATDIQNRIQSVQLNNDPKSWRTLKKEMGYPNKGSSYPDLKNDASIVKTDRNKLKQFAEQLKSMFTTKIDLKDKNLDREIGNFLILNIQDYFPLKSIDDHEEFVSINKLDGIINNLDIKKGPGLDCINSELIKHLKPALMNFLHFFFNLCINFGIHPANWKIAKVIMLHKAGKPEDLTGSYRPLSLNFLPW